MGDRFQVVQAVNKPKLVYVHGTNGSGKSTLARAVIAAAGGVESVSHLLPNKKATYTHTAQGLVLVGKYGNACGGVDGVAPYAAVLDIVEEQAKGWERSIFMEGLATPGLETCQRLAASVGGRALFIYLDVPVEQCIQNVLARRGRKGTTKEYNPANLIKKQKSASNWIRRLEANGLETASLAWDNAYARTLQHLGIRQPTLEDLL